MNILYYLAAIGEESFDIKKNIFFKNVKKIYQDINKKIDVIVNIYTEDLNFENDIKNSIYINNYFIYNKKGMLPELFLTNPYNNKVNNYDYILFMVDDVSIETGNINDIINVKNKYNLDIISPHIMNATQRYMQPLTINTLKIVNAIEFYLYIVTPEILLKIFNYHDINNSLLWGYDFLLGYFKFNCGIYSNYICNHHLRQENDSKIKPICGKTLMLNFIKKYGFNTIEEIKKIYPPIINTIHL